MRQWRRDCLETLELGKRVTLTVSPAQGYVFTRWGGACSGTGTCSITVDSTSLNVTAHFTPTQAPTPAIERTTLSAGGDHTCGIREDGTVECWGDNWAGQASPPSGIFHSLSAGRFHTCGLRKDGTVECWGDNSYGRSSPPSGMFRSVSARYLHTCGVREDGTVACWGSNEDGRTSPPSGRFRVDD